MYDWDTTRHMRPRYVKRIDRFTQFALAPASTPSRLGIDKGRSFCAASFSAPALADWARWKADKSAIA